MRASSREFQEYLAPGESVVTGISGTLFDDTYRSEGSIGVTDRRVLFVSDGDGFLDVAHDAISSIRSRPRTTVTYRGIGSASVAVLGASIAVAASVAVMALEPRAITFLLMLVTVGGIAMAEAVRRRCVDVEGAPLAEARARLLDALYGVELLRGNLGRWWVREDVSSERNGGDVPRGRDDGDDDLLILGIASVALTASIGLIAVTESLLVVPLALVTLGGLALTEHSFRQLSGRDATGVHRRRERDVSIHLVDGRIVHLRVDSTRRFDSDLSALVRTTTRRNADVELPSH